MKKDDGLRRDVGEIAGSIRDLRGELRGAVDDLRGMMRAVTSKVSKIDSKVSEMDRTVRRIAATTANTSVELTEFKKYVREEMVTKNEFHDRMDGFAGRLEDFKLHSARQEDRISQLEKRRPQS